MFVQLEQEVWAAGREQIRRRLESRLAEVAAQQAATAPPACCGVGCTGMIGGG